MVKSELINSIASKKPLLLHEDVTAIVDVMLASITNELANGGQVCVRGFGTFTLRYRAPKIGRNPQTGEKVAVEQKHAVHFKPSPFLSKRVDESSKKYLIQKI
ncbi:MAG: HU family DNA-binding protein [Methylococcaceae bacterium]